MLLRTALIGLNDLERVEFLALLQRMRVQADSFVTGEAAKAANQATPYHIAIIGYESEGCGLPLAVNLRGLATGSVALDCILVADQACPTLQETAADLGILAVLRRPVHASSLAAAIERHVEKRAA
jgi:DNA-binding NtrC family response regulator